MINPYCIWQTVEGHITLHICLPEVTLCKQEVDIFAGIKDKKYLKTIRIF